MIAIIIPLVLAVALGFVGFLLLQDGNSPRAGIVCLIAAVLVVLIGAGVYPYANVWQRSMSGRAQLAEAEANRQIKVREAQATKDAAELLAQAEVERARGVAEANRIVADGLGGPEGYLRYLYIEGLKEAHEHGAQVIYVPTEAGLPILEAGRLRAAPTKQ